MFPCLPQTTPPPKSLPFPLHNSELTVRQSRDRPLSSLCFLFYSLYTVSLFPLFLTAFLKSVPTLDLPVFLCLSQSLIYHTHSMEGEGERSTHAVRGRGRRVLMAGKSDWRREGGREVERDKVKHRSDFRTHSEDKHGGRQLAEVSIGPRRNH